MKKKYYYIVFVFIIFLFCIKYFFIHVEKQNFFVHTNTNLETINLVSNESNKNKKIESEQSLKKQKITKISEIDDKNFSNLFNLLKNKGLLTNQELLEYRQLLLNIKKIEKAFERLKIYDERDHVVPSETEKATYVFGYVNGSMPSAGEVERMHEIDYLSEAVRWNENPLRNEIKNKIKEFLLSDHITENLHGRIKRGMIGDKIELLILFKEEFPEDAKILFNTKNLPINVQNVFNFSSTFVKN